MGFYNEKIVPHLVDRACGVKGLDRWRSDVVEGTRGTVVEIGFGSGHNLPHFPPEVDLVYAVEPAGLAKKLAAQRVDAASTPVEYVGLDGQDIPLDDEACDCAVATFTLCTVPDPSQALRELHRILRPGGTFHFLEHGLAPDVSVARWQRRLDPFERLIADGCELTRDPLALVAASGFEIVDVTQRYGKGPKPWSYFTLGLAAKPG
jgi:SAM-dependent methyltransferase